MMVDTFSFKRLETSRPSGVADEPEKSCEFPPLVFTDPQAGGATNANVTYTTEELEKAIEKACKATELKVEEQTRLTLLQEHQHRQVQALEAIRDNLKSKEDAFEQWMSMVTMSSQEIAKLMGQTLVSKALEFYPLADIEETLRQSLQRLIEQPSIDVWLGPSLSEDIRNSMDEVVRDAGFRGKLNLLADPDLKAGEIRLTWKGGAIERDLGKIQEEVNSVINSWMSEHLDQTCTDQTEITEALPSLSPPLPLERPTS